MPELFYVVVARDPAGTPANVPLTGLSPRWVFLSRLADGVAVAPPAISEIGFGQYRIAYDPEAKGEASGQIDLGTRIVDPASRFVDVAFFVNESRTVVNLDAPVSGRMPAPNVVYLGADAATQGNWKGVYGAEGSWVVGDTSGINPNLPASITASNTGGTSFTWGNPSTDPRALVKTVGSGRIASCWYTSTSMTFAVNVAGDRSLKVSLYAMDFEVASRSMRVEVIDPAGNVVDTRVLSAFRFGNYLTWSVKGQVTIRVTNLQASTNAVVSGLFFG